MIEYYRFPTGLESRLDQVTQNCISTPRGRVLAYKAVSTKLSSWLELQTSTNLVCYLGQRSPLSQAGIRWTGDNPQQVSALPVGHEPGNGDG